MSAAFSTTVSWLSRLVESPEAEAELLHRYATTGDQEAFAALTERFAPLVWGVCSRALRNQQDAEDAFQATFLALSKQAARLSDREPLGAWLHLVARRSAALVYRQNQRRREVPVDSAPAAAATPATDDRELAAALDEEIGQLPEKYRRPIVLCHLQQHTYAEAAAALGSSVPTICRRVTQGCELLRNRLTRRGLVPASGLAVLFTALAQPATAMPPGLVARTVQAVGSGVAGVSAGVSVAVLRSAGWSRALLCSLGAATVALAGAVAVGLASFDAPPAAPPAADAAPVPVAARAEPRVDRFGDPLPDGAIARIGTLRMRGEGGWPGDVAFLPGGRTVASVHGRSAVWLWDVATGKELGRVPAPERSHQLVPSPDGHHLAVCGETEVRLLNVAAAVPAVAWRWAPGDPRAQHRVTSAAFSPDGKTLAIGDSAISGARLLDVATGAELRLFTGGAVHDLAFTPDGKTLGGLANGKPTRLTREAARLALWDAATGTPREVPEAAAGAVGRFVFAGGSVVLTPAQVGQQIRAVDLATGRETARWPDRGLHAILAPTSDGAAVAELAGGKVTVRDPATGSVVRSSGTIHELAIVDRQVDVYGWKFSADGRLFAATTRNGQVWVWDVVGGKEVGLPGRIHGGVQSLAFSPDGATVTTLHGSAGRSWAAGSGTPAAPLAGNEAGELAASEVVFTNGAGPTVIQFPTPDDRSLRATTWDAATGVAADRLPIPADVWETGAASGAVSPDGRWLAWGTPAVLTLINRATGQEVRRMTPAVAAPATLRFSADGRALLRVPQGKGVAEVWDAETGKRRASLALPAKYRGPTSPPVLAVSADGRWLVAAGKQANGAQALVLTEIDTAACYQVPAPKHAVHSLAFSPDGRRLAAAAEDGAVRVWDLATGAEVRAYHGHQGRALVVAFSPDGTRLASGGLDGTGLVWDAPPPPAVQANRGAAAWWAALTGTDTAAAHRATFEATETLVPVIAGHLRTDTGPVAVRGVAALERIGSPAARQVLKAVAERSAADPVGGAADAALKRLAR